MSISIFPSSLVLAAYSPKEKQEIAFLLPLEKGKTLGFPLIRSQSGFCKNSYLSFMKQCSIKRGVGADKGESGV